MKVTASGEGMTWSAAVDEAAKEWITLSATEGTEGETTLTVTVQETPQVSQPGPLANGQTVVTPQSNITIDQPKGNNMFVWPSGTSLEVVVRGRHTEIDHGKAKAGAGSATVTKGAKAATELAEKSAESKLTGAAKIAAGLKKLAKTA